MRVMVTGGAGFIGYHLGSKLIREGHELAAVDNFNSFYDPALKRKNIRDLERLGTLRLFETDILDRKGLQEAFRSFGPEAVVHLAAWAGVRPSLNNPQLYSDVNVTGTVNLLELAREYRVAAFIFGSSSSVYGANSKVPFSEDDPVDKPVSPYAATKRAGELLCHTYSYNYGLHVACLRFFTVYGPRQRPEMAIHKFARLIRDGAEVPVFGEGDSRRDYTYVDDIVGGILGSLRLNPRYEVLNLGGSNTIGLIDLIRLLESALGREARIKHFPFQAGDMQITYADIKRARDLLGYNPATPISDGIRKFADWFIRENPR
jgi:UDP-glucuronate 4-epimerase